MLYNEEKSKARREAFKNYKNYGIIIVLTLITVTVFPLLGTQVGMEANYPNTVAGWIVWSVIKIALCVDNIFIFQAFVDQAELNVQYEPRYIEAREIVRKYRIGKYNPMSPEERRKKMFSKKVIITILTSLISVALTEAILKYNFADLIAYTISMLMAVVFGILSMADQEKYWIEEFYDYAITIKEEEEAKEKQKQAEIEAFKENSINNTDFVEKLENELNLIKKEDITNECI
jgi:hypothetical protein